MGEQKLPDFVIHGLSWAKHEYEYAAGPFLPSFLHRRKNSMNTYFRDVQGCGTS